MASEVIGTCQRCGKPLTYLPELGIVSVDATGQLNPGWVTYEARCDSDGDHLLRLNLGIPGLPNPVVDLIGKWAAEQHAKRDEDKAEMYWRARNRAIADAHQKEMAEHRGHQAVMGEWHDGTCKGCGMQDQVIGVPGSEYCRYCEELRTLAPAPPAEPPKQIEPPPAQLIMARRARHSLGLACLMISVILAASGQGVFLPGLFLVWGVLFIRSAR